MDSKLIEEILTDLTESDTLTEWEENFVGHLLCLTSSIYCQTGEKWQLTKNQQDRLYETYKLDLERR